MKKVALLIFILFSSFMLYQIILGRNGIIEKYELKNQEGKLVLFKELLNNKKKENQDYIDYLLKDNSDAYKTLAEELGFLKNDSKLIRVVHDKDDDLSADIYLASRESKKTKNDLMLENFESTYKETSFLMEIKTVITMVFFIVIAFFVIVTILSGEENENEE